MNAITEERTRANRLEGFVLTAIFQGLPVYAAAVLLLKLTHSHEIVGAKGGAVIFVVLASLFHAWLTPWLGTKFPRYVRNGYEPLFFDASLSFAEKIAQWRIQPAASLQLLTTVMMLSLLAVGVASMG